jgi:hypothetical protein
VYSRPVFLKLASLLTQNSARGCEGFREMKMCNGGGVLLDVPHLYVRIKVRFVTFSTNHSVIDITQSTQKLHDSAVKSVNRAGRRVKESGQTIMLSISLRLAVDFLHYLA